MLQMSKMTEVVTKMMFDKLEEGVRTKEQIYDDIEKELQVPRPTIRAIARKLRIKLNKWLTVLNLDTRIGEPIPEDADVPRIWVGELQ